MNERQQRRGKSVGLNLVSLMDIFTILVFFLLVNSSEVQTLPSTKGVDMPESIAQTQPRQTLVVKITAEQILVEGNAVLSVADALASKNTVLEPLRGALLAEKRPEADAAQTEITIMGDKALSYRVLKKVMSTCAMADFERVSLAVMQRAPDAVGS
ncbi:MAG: biopolymer transporter ExbD [Gammaproteobacteria bacterium]|nr:biopolymer transporter ExbD [Gammaproteobacteria bacterium]NNF61775.1 biopolymer transporter ExbD [Gammaproteobacteria bacterium]NNM20442.1 biopolymer transporter ExbD [Gammaproteobacteria bacterium]